MQVVNRLKSTLDNPFIFNALQFAIAGTQNKTRRLIREGLQLKAGERLLDVCCGTGEFADVALNEYIGIDINPKYIEYAEQRFGKGNGHPERAFVAQDITGYEFSRTYGTFPKAMLINSMHHLSDAENLAVLEGIARVTTERFVIVDMDPTPSNPLSRFLAKQDRGQFIRPLAEQIALAEKFFEVERGGEYYSGLCGQTIIVCKVRS
ncbi:class I SAM-dependent methyltransferase (plasmid) [Candidatus Chlorohelix allophototropha]|nr:class I SAM-dependent methyltransferase [Chloroflexota bacterium L227-S17]